MSWYVNTNEDVADFRVELTKVGTEGLEVGYNKDSKNNASA